MEIPKKELEANVRTQFPIEKSYLLVAKLILKDRSIYKRITVHEINSFWIVFLKNGSLHDMLIEKIARIQYGNEVGPIVSFNKDNKIVISN